MLFTKKISLKYKETLLSNGNMSCFLSPAPGKCSHGGAGDLTSTAVPRGGINKDERRADNAAFHSLAVNLATAATSELLDNIELAVGPDKFLRYAR